MNNNPSHDASIQFNAAALETPREQDNVSGAISLRRRLRRFLWHVLARQFMLLPVVALAIARLVGWRRRPIPHEGCEILLTGRFDSDNWILAHLGPLAASKECSRLWMVSTNPVPEVPKVIAIYPPKWLIKVIGATQARLLTFLLAAIRKRPHVVGGFNIMFNGIAAVIVGRLTGARSMYFCVGGPPEICDGGVHSVESLFMKMETADAVVESRLLKIVAESDTVITMGTKAVSFFCEKGIDSDLHIVPGGINPIRFQPANGDKKYDLILTGRLVNIKRIDVFLKAVQYVAKKFPDVRAIIVGDGKLRNELHSLSADMRIERNVSFAGYQDNVESWLQKSKIFVLTSDSEGLSLSVIEAMMSGLPAVVSNVGDLGDLVKDVINGYLVPRRSPEFFASHIIELLSDSKKMTAFSNAAHQSAISYTTEAITKKWDEILQKYRY